MKQKRITNSIFAVITIIILAVMTYPGLLSAITNVAGTQYADTGWNGVHGGPKNDDYADVEVKRAFKSAWRQADGVSLEMAPTIGIDGKTILLATGYGPGKSNMHAYDLDGNILWETPPWTDASGFDSGAAFQSPIVDLDGDIYVSDCNQFWAFKPDGTVKWVIDLPLPPVGAPFQDITAAPYNPFCNAFFLQDGSVAGLTHFGHLLIMNRSDGSLKAPIFTLPGIASFTVEEPQLGVFEGTVDPELRSAYWNWIWATDCYISADTPAVHPVTGRMFVSAKGSTGGNSLWGVDYTPGTGGAPGTISVAFESPLDVGGGLSPALSPANDAIYAGTSAGNIKAFNTTTGEELWSVNPGTGPGSTSVGPDGKIYAVAGSGTAINPDGTIAWTANLEPLLKDFQPHPTLGMPSLAADSILTLGKDTVIFAVIMAFPIPLGGQTVDIPIRAVLVTVDMETGELIEGMQPYELRSSHENMTIPLENGMMLTAYGSLRATTFAPLAPIVNPILFPYELLAVDPGLEAIVPVEHPIAIVAGEDREISSGDDVSLDGSGSYDQDGEIVSYEWLLKNKLFRSDSRTVEGPTPTVSGLGMGIYDVSLTVTDDEGLTDTDSIVVRSCFISALR